MSKNQSVVKSLGSAQHQSESPNKMAKLEEFIEANSHLPEQGSEQWLKDRLFTIGGSEMSVITGDNPYKNIRGLIEQHIGTKTFKGNINTIWGSILEDLVVQILEGLWHARIFETGSLKGVVEGQKYSPDGLVYLSFWDMIILLEIKCAVRRIAGKSVPKMYLPQIYTGLDTIPLADKAIFVDAMFRRCSLADHKLDNKNYDTEIHPKKPVPDPIALHMVAVYSIGKMPPKKVYDPSLGVLDLGSCSTWRLEEILKMVKAGELERAFVRDMNDLLIVKEKVNNLIYGYCGIKIIGVLPLKLFKLLLKPVERIPGYVKKYEAKIREVIKTIRHLESVPEKWKKIELEKKVPGPKAKMIDAMAERMKAFMKKRKAGKI